MPVFFRRDAGLRSGPSLGKDPPRSSQFTGNLFKELIEGWARPAFDSGSKSSWKALFFGKELKGELFYAVIPNSDPRFS